MFVYKINTIYGVLPSLKKELAIRKPVYIPKSEAGLKRIISIIKNPDFKIPTANSISHNE